MRCVVAIALLVAFGCRGPEVSAPAAGDGAALPAGSAARQAYWSERDITLDAWTVGEWAAVDVPLPICLSIANNSSQPLVLTLSRRTSWWPFGHVESAEGVLDVQRSGPVIGLGSRAMEERRELPLPEGNLELAPGEEVLLELDLDARVQRWRPYQELRVRTAVFPLAVQYGDEPERFVALDFPDLHVCLIPPSVLEASALGDWTAFDRCFDGPAEHLLAFALRYARLDRIRVTDQLMGALPGRSMPHRAAMLAALAEITGQEHGDHIDRWRSWWASREGTRWAMEMRRSLDPSGSQ